MDDCERDSGIEMMGAGFGDRVAASSPAADPIKADADGSSGEPGLSSGPSSDVRGSEPPAPRSPGRRGSADRRRVERDSGCVDPPVATEDEDVVFVRVFIHDQNLQRCHKFRLDETVFAAKRRVLSTLAKDLKDGLNYGFFQPPHNFKAGKFLQEDRMLREYPMADKPIGYLEFKYKRRVYKTSHVDERYHRQLHAKANLKRFLGYVAQGVLEKVTKLTEKGLDANFQDVDTGETPLTLCAGIKDPRVCRDMVLALVNGGAHLDFRARDGATPLHRVAVRGNRAALKVLLELGASPNYKDSKGLSPVHYAIAPEIHPDCLGLLLHDHAHVGSPDLQGWFEIHVACRFGLARHLELLLLYGADMNSRNDSGNTCLHICALNNQEACAKLLLLRGADKNSQNYANHTPFQVAIISGNDALAEIIKNHRSDDVLPFGVKPKFNEKRRSEADVSPALVRGLSRTNSESRLDRLTQNPPAPPSPSPSQHSLPPFSGSNSSRCSSPNIAHTSRLVSPQGALQTPSKDSSSHSPLSSSSNSSGKGSSLCGSPIASRHIARRRLLDHLASPSKSPRNNSNNKNHTANGPRANHNNAAAATATVGLGGSGSKPPLSPPLHPLRTVPPPRTGPPPPRTAICTKSYSPRRAGEIRLNRGDFVKLLVLEEGTGVASGQVLRADLGVVQSGTFPADCVEEVHLRGGVAISDSSAPPSKRPQPRFEKKEVVLKKSKVGYGFILRGPKSHSGRLEHFRPTAEMPALQYVDVVDDGSPAAEAELRPGDFIVAINSESVVNASHEYAVKQIKKSGASVTIKILRLVEAEVEEATQEEDEEETDAAPSTIKSPLVDVAGAMTLPSRARLSSSESLAWNGANPIPGNERQSVSIESGAASKFASIKGRHRLSSQRMSAAELEAIIARHGVATAEVIHKSASNQAKPVIPVPPFQGTPPTPRGGEKERDVDECEVRENSLLESRIDEEVEDGKHRSPETEKTDFSEEKNEKFFQETASVGQIALPDPVAPPPTINNEQETVKSPSSKPQLYQDPRNNLPPRKLPDARDRISSDPLKDSKNSEKPETFAEEKVVVTVAPIMGEPIRKTQLPLTQLDQNGGDGDSPKKKLDPPIYVDEASVALQALDHAKKMKEFDERLRGKFAAAGADLRCLDGAGQGGTLPANLVRGAGKLPPATPTGQQHVASPGIKNRKPTAMSSQVRNVSAFGTMNAAQSQFVRQALTQQLNQNSRLNPRVMSPPARSSYAKKEALAARTQRSRSVPRKGAAVAWQPQALPPSVVSQELAAGQIPTNLVYGAPAEIYQARAFNGDAAGPAVYPPVGYAVVYNPYASLARPTTTRFANPMSVAYGTLPSKVAQWRRNSDVAFQTSPYHVLYDSVTGAYYASQSPYDPAAPEHAVVQIPTAAPPTQFVNPQLTYAVGPYPGKEADVAAVRGADGRIFIPEPDYPGSDGYGKSVIGPLFPEGGGGECGSGDSKENNGGVHKSQKKSVTFSPFVSETSLETPPESDPRKTDFCEIDSIQL